MQTLQVNHMRQWCLSMSYHHTFPERNQGTTNFPKNHHDPCTHTFDLSEEVDLRQLRATPCHTV